MAKTCLEFYRFESARRESIVDPGGWLYWQKHLKQCQECRVQWTAQNQLQELMHNMALPKLSSDFNSRLQGRLHKKPAPRSLDKQARRWMQVYWATASLISLFIIFRLEWPERLPWGSYLLLPIVIAIAVVELLPARTIQRTAALLGLHQE